MARVTQREWDAQRKAVKAKAAKTIKAEAAKAQKAKDKALAANSPDSPEWLDKAKALEAANNSKAKSNTSSTSQEEEAAVDQGQQTQS